MKLFSTLALSITLAMTTGCTHRLGDFTAISSKNLDLSHGADFKRGVARVKGEDNVPIILTIPMGQPNMKTALDRAIETTPGAVSLVDAVLTQKCFWFILGGQCGFELEGTPLIDPNLLKR